MTQEQISILQKYESNFNTAINHNYTRTIPSKELEVLHSIYEEHIGKQYHFCKHCSTSILNFMKKLGQVYNTEKIRFEKQEEENGTIHKGRKRK